jgi:hypothetical protein
MDATNTKKYLIFNRNVLKIAAMVLMLLNHIGAFFVVNDTLYTILRILGRGAFVLYAFFIAEGAIKTSNPFKYFVRLLISYVIYQVILLIAYQVAPSSVFTGNIYLTLLGGASILLYFHHKLYKHVYLLIPFILNVTFNVLVLAGVCSPLINIFTAEYNFYGLLLIIGFYLMTLIANAFTKNQALKYQLDIDYLKETGVYQLNLNVIQCIFLLTYSFVWYLLSDYASLMGLDAYLQTYSILIFPLLMFYNGKSGYKAKWWDITYYLFYPVHMIIFGIIYYFINL